MLDGCANSCEFCIRYVWKGDTALPGRPLYVSGDRILYDYSSYKTTNVTPSNYNRFIDLDLDVSIHHIETLPVSDAERIMQDNVEVVLSLEKVIHKAEKIKEIVEETSSGYHHEVRNP